MTLEDLQAFTLQYGDVYFHPVGSQRQQPIQRVYCYKKKKYLVMLTYTLCILFFLPLQNIYHCAKLAVGAALQLVDSIMTGKVRNGMALVR